MTERSLGTVVRDIVGNVDRIVRAEARFAIAGLRMRVEDFSDASVLLVASVVAATLAAGFLLLGGMFALATLMPLWLAATVIAAVPGALAAVLFIQFRAEFARHLAPASREVLTVPRGVT